jgi:hypothetical protein
MGPEGLSTFESGYNKSSLFLLYGGMRKKLFLNKHPLDGPSLKQLGIQRGNAFYDLNKQELEYKDSNWRVKANFGQAKLFNLKTKLGTKKKGETRNNIQFGTDQSDFDSDRSKSKMSVGGMFTCGAGGILATTRLKIFNDKALEVFTDMSVGALTLASDMRVTQTGYTGFVGASVGHGGVHVGGILALPSKGGPNFSLGLFGEVPAPGLQKAIVGAEFFSNGKGLIGAELTVDKEHSVNSKVGTNGIAHVSVIKRFPGIVLRMGTEANLNKLSAGADAFGRFGAQVTLTC